MTIEALQNHLPAFAKDMRLNLSAILSTQEGTDLTLNQVHGIALATAFATKQPMLIETMKVITNATLSKEEQEATQAAATIMAMNNIYYRFIHLMSDKSYAALPVKLRMNVIGNPGVSKIDFELYCLAVSALNGCGMCMQAHAKALEEGAVSKLGVQTAIRVAAVMNGVAMGLSC